MKMKTEDSFSKIHDSQPLQFATCQSDQVQVQNKLQRERPLQLFFNDERGLSSVEYVILLVMIVVGAVATWKNIGSNIKEGLGKAESDSQLITEGTGN